MSDGQEVVIPKVVEDQKVELSLRELTQLTAKTSAVPDQPKVSKKDYIRLAELKIDKMFKPRIAQLRSRVFNVEKAYTADFPPDEGRALAVKAAKRHGAALCKEITNLFIALRKGGEKIKSFGGSLSDGVSIRGEYESSVKVTKVFIKDESVEYVVNTSLGSTDVQTFEPEGKLKAFISGQKSAWDTVLKARADLETMEKSYSKAKGEVVSEVELGILEATIGKSDGAEEMANSINSEISKSVQPLLGEGK